MKKQNIKTIYDEQFKCRRCGEFSPQIGEKSTYPELGTELPFSLDFEEWFWTRKEREEENTRLSRISGVEHNSSIPDPFRLHRCKDGQMGLADFVGFVNPRKIKPRGRGWVVVEEDKTQILNA